jgi:xanthine dehydrogenase YagR molybdenum-binding subunit
MATDTVVQSTLIMGKSVPRIDGPQKTTGTAMYSSDYHFPGLAFAVPV